MRRSAVVVQNVKMEGEMRCNTNEDCPQQESNLRLRLRRATLYPLSYGGGLQAL